MQGPGRALACHSSSGRPHHPVTLRVPPLLGQAPTTPSRCACHPSSGRRGVRFLPASHEAGWRPLVVAWGRLRRRGGVVLRQRGLGNCFFHEGHGGHGGDHCHDLQGRVVISNAECSAFLEHPLFHRVLRVLRGPVQEATRRPAAGSCARAGRTARRAPDGCTGSPGTRCSGAAPETAAAPCVSTPSATTFMPSSRPSTRIAPTMAAFCLSPGQPATKVRSILSSSIGKRLR